MWKATIIRSFYMIAGECVCVYVLRTYGWMKLNTWPEKEWNGIDLVDWRRNDGLFYELCLEQKHNFGIECMN